MFAQRTIAIVALLSLLLNALLVGFIGAQWMRRAAGPPAWRLAPFEAGAPAPRVIHKLRAMIESEIARADESAARTGVARAAVLQALQSEPFNGEAVTAALAQLRVANNDVSESFHRAIVATAASLSVEDRAELAVLLARVGGPGGLGALGRPGAGGRMFGPQRDGPPAPNP